LLDLNFDREHLWHPYTSLEKPLPVYPVIGAEGCEIILEDGTRLIDGMSSWWCAIHGYNNKDLNLAISEQINKMSHVMFGGLTHEPAINLAKKIINIVPKGLEKVFYADSGSVSVEVAIKMAIQYWRSQGNYQKSKMLTISRGYHGDTFGAMSVCDPINGMHHLFKGTISEQIFSEKPRCRFDDKWYDRYLEDLRTKIIENHESIAGLILEPILQGAGGMWFYSPMFLKKAKLLCEEYDILLIVDEIATGFARTGKMFASEWAEIIPDIMCIGKALTGGYMTLAATLTTKKVADIISQNFGVFMHGPTFMANPLACSVACKSIELLEKMDWQAKIINIEKILHEGLTPLQQHSKVLDVRVLGAVGVVELQKKVDVAFFQKKCVENNVWVRPFGKLIYLMPPYIITKKQLEKLIEVVRYFLMDSNI
jgi:adenosylmethionine---8-amino-7-oxononanoate aminotransferase